MSLPLNVNGIVYQYPEQGDTNWGQATTLWAQAVTQGMLQKAGGTFVLTANVDFGGSFGLIASSFRARSANVAQTGSFRLSAADFIAIRNQANSADLPLGINVSDQLTFDGAVLLTSAFSGITNANIAAGAAIDLTKLAPMTASRAVVSDASGFMVASAVTATEIGYLAGVSSSLQTQLNNKLSLSGGTLTGTLLLAGLPTLANEAANKQYVDNAMLGISPKAQSFVATVVAGTLATDFEDGQTVDGEVLTTGDQILIKNQVAAEENGIYIVQASGAPVRSTEADTWAEVIQAYTFVTNGTVNAGSGWLSTATSGGTIDVTPLNFNQFSGSIQYTTDGEGIEVTGTQFSLELDGSTLSKSASGLRVAASVISDIAAKVTNPLTTNGDIIVQAAGVPARLGVGTTGQLLTVVAGAPAWQTFDLNPVVVPGSTGATLTSADSNKVYLVDTSSARSFQLPAPATGLNFTIKDATGQANTNNITLLRNASEQIEGIAASKILQTNWGSWRVISDGTNWFIL